MVSMPVKVTFGLECGEVGTSYGKLTFFWPLIALCACARPSCWLVLWREVPYALQRTPPARMLISSCSILCNLSFTDLSELTVLDFSRLNPVCRLIAYLGRLSMCQIVVGLAIVRPAAMTGALSSDIRTDRVDVCSSGAAGIQTEGLLIMAAPCVLAAIVVRCSLAKVRVSFASVPACSSA